MTGYFTNLEEALALAATMLRVDTFVAADEPTQTAALEEAADRIDAAGPWQGRKFDPDQARQFPRLPYADTMSVWDLDVDTLQAIVPRLVKIASLREAEEILLGTRDVALDRAAAGLASQSVGNLSESYRDPVAANPSALCRQAGDLLRVYRLKSGRML